MKCVAGFSSSFVSERGSGKSMTWRDGVQRCRPREQPPLCNTVRALRTAYRATFRRLFPDFEKGGFPVF